MYHSDQINILTKVQTTVKNHGAKALTDRLQVRLQTLYADVDPNSIGRRTNKLGLLDYLVILSESGDLSSLDAINKLFGRINFTLPETEMPDNEMSWMEHCAVIAKESGEAVAELANSILDGRMEPAELEQCEIETWEALTAYTRLYIAIKNSRN